ncbi:MAG: hypothetical protein EOS28_32285, partial [Mesorhizobium sp.]
DTLVTVGGVQSNRTRMVAAVAAKIGMKAACWSVHTRQTSFVRFPTFQRAEICSASANMLLQKNYLLSARFSRSYPYMRHGLVENPSNFPFPAREKCR